MPRHMQSLNIVVCDAVPKDTPARRISQTYFLIALSSVATNTVEIEST